MISWENRQKVLLPLGPCTAVCVPEAGKRCGWTEAALGGSLVWPTADCCRWRNRRMEKTSPGLCSSKETALWTSAVTSDYDVANQQFVQLQSSNVGVITLNDFVTDVVGSLEYCSAVASTFNAEQENLSWYSVLKISHKVTHAIKCWFSNDYFCQNLLLLNQDCWSYCKR